MLQCYSSAIVVLYSLQLFAPITATTLTAKNIKQFYVLTEHNDSFIGAIAYQTRIKPQDNLQNQGPTMEKL